MSYRYCNTINLPQGRCYSTGSISTYRRRYVILIYADSGNMLTVKSSVRTQYNVNYFTVKIPNVIIPYIDISNVRNMIKTISISSL